MKKTMILAVALLAACGSSSDPAPPPPSLDTPAAIHTYLTGKTWVMQGADLPPYPNGYNENVNYGSATQCYNRVQIATDTNWAVTSTLGTLTGAPNLYDVGTCNNAAPAGSPLSYTSTAVLVENVHGNGDCFDVSVNYGSFSQAGRGKFTDDGRTLTLELFFSGQATGANCAAGAVGSGGIVLNTVAFTQDAQQVYRLQ